LHTWENVTVVGSMNSYYILKHERIKGSVVDKQILTWHWKKDIVPKGRNCN